jgi:integrase
LVGRECSLIRYGVKTVQVFFVILSNLRWGVNSMSKNKGNGVKQQPNGKWEFRVRYQDSNGKWREKSKSGFRTKKEAEIARIEVKKQALNDVDLSSADITIKDFLDEWLNVFKKPHISQKTYEIYSNDIRLHLLPIFANKKLKDINRAEYKKFIVKKRETHAWNTVKGINSIMHNALDFAVKELEILQKNVIHGISIPKDDVVVEEEIKCYDFDELNKLLDLCFKNTKNLHYFYLFKFLARTGLRFGESVALQWSDINLDTKKMTVTKSIRTRGQEIVFGPTKTRKNRTVTLDDDLIAMLKKWKSEQSANILKIGKRNKEYDFIFTDRFNDRIRSSNARDYYVKLCAKHEIKYITLHGFRHTHIVHLLQSGVDLKSVAERVGHTSINTTAVYMHVTKSMEEQAMNKYESFLKFSGQIVGK